MRGFDFESRVGSSMSRRPTYEAHLRDHRSKPYGTTPTHDKLSFNDGKFFHLWTMGKLLLVPGTLVTSIVAMHHKSNSYGHLGVLRTMALIKRDYVCSHL